MGIFYKNLKKNYLNLKLNYLNLLTKHLLVINYSSNIILKKKKFKLLAKKL